MSDPLYSHQHLDLYHKKNQGILQFGKSQVKREDAYKIEAKLKEYTDETI